MKIFIHAGLSKTGSSHIQKFIKNNQKLFFDNGFYIPPYEESSYDSTFLSGNSVDFINSILYHSSQSEDLKNIAVSFTKKIIAQAREKNCEKILLTNEFFCTLNHDQINCIIGSMRECKANVHFLVFVRNPYDWYFSSWVQSLRAYGNQNWIDKSLELDPEYSLKALLFPKILKSIDENIYTLIDYEANKHRLVEAFLDNSSIKEPYVFDKNNIDSNKVTNKSLGRTELAVYLTINRSSSGDRSLTANAANLIDLRKEDRAIKFMNTNAFNLVSLFCSKHGIKCDKPKNYSSHIDTEESFFSSLPDDLAHLLKYIAFLAKKHAGSQEDMVETLRLRIIQAQASPCKYMAPSFFSIAEYLTLNRDVLYSDIDPYWHYLEFGQHEKTRRITFNTISASAQVSERPR